MKKQYYVTLSGIKQKKQAITWLETHGYKNVQKLTSGNYSFPVIVIEGKCFFGTNTTCMAAGITTGHLAISWEGWLSTIVRGK